MRPRVVSDFIGQSHILAPGRPLYEALIRGAAHSMILWGPPGTGKTTLANIVAASCDAHVEWLSAVLAGVKDIRQAVDRARERQRSAGRATILFVDEVHRFNKGQQDAFLPHIEDGTVIFIGATTENPSFELNNALLSRARTYVLRALDDEALEQILAQALHDTERGLGRQQLELAPGMLEQLARAADGDARRALNLLELAADLAVSDGDRRLLDEAALSQVLEGGGRRFDKGGDLFYEQISAMHKAVRGSAPDAALYWMMRMLDGGCDPLYIARRLVRMASEDIGNADPRALQISMSAWDAMIRLGSPEGELTLGQAVLYLACAPKSNAVYQAFNAAAADMKAHGSLDVPEHLRNAPTRLMKEMGYGEAYRYAHDEPEHYAAGENYFPPELQQMRYYHPSANGLERKIGEKLEYLRRRDEESPVKRYNPPFD
ncbi:MAG: replication-associated recombination protein A [Pseudomonadota bacterium]